MRSYTEREFPKHMVGTAGIDHKVKDIMTQGKHVKMEVWDSAGQDKFRAFINQQQNYYRGVCGIILVFDLADQKSFEDLTKYWIPTLKDTLDEPVELLLLGNKNDLINDRVISQEDANSLLENHADL